MKKSSWVKASVKSAGTGWDGCGLCGVRPQWREGKAERNSVDGLARGRVPNTTRGRDFCCALLDTAPLQPYPSVAGRAECGPRFVCVVGDL